MFIEWLKELLDRNYRCIRQAKMVASSKQQRLAIIWNSYEKCNYPIHIPPHITNVFTYVLDQIRDKQEYFTDYFDYREKKVASGSDIE